MHEEGVQQAHAADAVNRAPDARPLGARIREPFSLRKGGLCGMRYKVVLQKSEEGYSVSCPGLPGCWSQGATEAEALENIQDAIREYLAAVDDVLHGTPDAEVWEVEVVVSRGPSGPASIISTPCGRLRRQDFVWFGRASIL